MLVSRSRNTGTTDLVTWPLKSNLVESIQYTDAWLMEQGVRPWQSL